MISFSSFPMKMLAYEVRIEACREAWDQRAVKEPPTECLVQLLTLVLKHSNFTFNGEHFLQINGTAMGTKMSPTSSWGNLKNLAVRNTFGAMFRMTTLWGQVLMFICRFVVYVS
jgi:hypothetical protein